MSIYYLYIFLSLKIYLLPKKNIFHNDEFL